MLECIRCNKVAFAADVASLTVTLTCEEATDTLALCSDCQRTLHWTARNLIAFVRRQTVAAMTLTMEGVSR